MGITLAKGQKVSLTKTNPGLKKVVVGLGWDTNKYDGGFDFDLDASAFLTGANGKVTNDGDFIFYNNLKHASQRLKDNVNVVAIAGRQNPEAVKYASERVRNSEELKFRLNATDKDLNNENYQEEKEKTIKRNIEIKKSKSKGAERTLEKEDSSGWY